MLNVSSEFDVESCGYRLLRKSRKKTPDGKKVFPKIFSVLFNKLYRYAREKIYIFIGISFELGQIEMHFENK